MCVGGYDIIASCLSYVLRRRLGDDEERETIMRLGCDRTMIRRGIGGSRIADFEN